MDPWNLVAEDRRALADYLGTLSPDEWNARSWCADWTVKDVAAHLLVSPTMSNGQIVAATRDTADVQSAPPPLRPLGVLGEVLAHSNDISSAVGRSLLFPVEHCVVGLDYLKDAQAFLGCKKRIEGLGLKATDAAWSTGDGPLVEGDVQHLLSAMTGRAAALAGLLGDGVEIMASR
jgi:hypothetical protein